MGVQNGGEIQDIVGRRRAQAEVRTPCLGSDLVCESEARTRLPANLTRSHWLVPNPGENHSLPLRLEESSSLGSGGIFGPGAGGESGSGSRSDATSLFRPSARPRRPIAIKIAPPIISQCGNSVDESIYLPLALSPPVALQAAEWQRATARRGLGSALS